MGNNGGRSALCRFKDEYVKIGYEMALLGATNKQLAAAFGVSELTLGNWYKIVPEFAAAVHAGKERADAEVANSLFQRAKGYRHPDVHIVTLRDRATGDVQVIKTDIEKYYPPDTTACIFWLKNRQRALWRDVNRVEHTGADGRPIQKNVHVDLTSLTDDELQLALKLGLNLTGDDGEERTMPTAPSTRKPQ